MSDRHIRYCPRCGARLARRRNRPGDVLRPTCPACRWIHFDNPAPAAGVLIENDRGEVLLGRRALPPFRGWWGIVGGFVEGAEHPEETAVREVLEETGLRVRLVGLHGIWMDRYGKTGDYTVNIMFRARIISGDLCPADDVLELRWFARDALPARIAFRNGRAALKAWALTLTDYA
ncbi:MAG: NUDIX domain-containing protein [Armatimonadetes bacterium]|nr:NUDIX domain-containing protein [Armatimonadota bacterium]